MAASGLLTSVYGARWVWVMAGVVYFIAAGVALVMTRWMPVAAEEQEEAVEIAARAAASTLDSDSNGHGAQPVPQPQSQPPPQLQRQPERMLEFVPREDWLEDEETVDDEERPGTGLERIASLLERIDRRRELEARRPRD